MNKSLEAGGFSPEGDKQPKPFHWREWIENIELISEESVVLLDNLEEIINDDKDTDNTDFRRDVYDLSTKMQSGAILSLTGNLRSALTKEERNSIGSDIEKAGTKIPFEYFE